MFFQWFSQDSVEIQYTNSTEIQWKISDDILSLGGAVENEVFGPPSSTPGQRELMPEQNPLICTKALRVAFKIQDL